MRCDWPLLHGAPVHICHVALTVAQRLDKEKQAVCELSQRQQQDCKLQLQWMQQHCEEALQQERVQNSQQVKLLMVAQQVLSLLALRVARASSIHWSQTA